MSKLINDDSVYTLLDDASSIDRAMQGLVFLARDMDLLDGNPELEAMQKPAKDYLRIIADYSESLNKKCMALIAKTESQGCGLSGDELATKLDAGLEPWELSPIQKETLDEWNKSL